MSKETFTIASKSVLRDVMMKVWQCVCSMAEDDTHGVEVTVKAISRRRSQANALMWVRLHELEDQMLWHGIKLTAEEYKDLLSSSLHEYKTVPNIAGNGFVIIGMRTSEMTIKQMSDMIELIHAFGADHGVKFSADPNVYG